ncbi:MAG: prepilin-type N-terminal cleavage/methylation domain-containing protein [Candidatus Eutrophobiaceae bacterium]
MPPVCPWKQCGLSLIELLVTLAVLAAASAWQWHKQLRQLQLRKAELTATRLADYQNAVAHWVSHHGSSSPAGDYSGSAWLKSRTECAGGMAGNAWLPCPFPDSLPFELPLLTRVTLLNGQVIAETELPAVRVNGQLRTDLAWEIANGALVKTHPRAGMHEITVHPNTHSITARYNNQNGKADFLRIDGNNQMEANLNSGGHSIVDADTVEFGDSLLGTGANSGIELGGRGGPPSFTDIQGSSLKSGTGMPYIDFHHGNGRQEDFNVRIQNDADGQLRISNNTGMSVNIFDLPQQTLRDIRIVYPGAVLSKPLCRGKLNAQIFLAPTSFLGSSDGGQRRTIAGVRTWAENLNSAAWRVHFEILSEGLSWTPSHAPLLAVSRCAPP